MVHVKRYEMKYKKHLLFVLVIVFASCGGGGGGGSGGGASINPTISSITSSNASTNMMAVGF